MTDLENTVQFFRCGGIVDVSNIDRSTIDLFALFLCLCIVLGFLCCIFSRFLFGITFLFWLSFYLIRRRRRFGSFLFRGLAKE